PTFSSVTVSVAASPDFSSAVALPTQAFFAEVAVGVVQILKLWVPRPAFLTLKVITPAGSIENFDSLNASSDGFPTVTFTIVTLALVGAFTPPDASVAAPRSQPVRPRQHSPRDPSINRVYLIEERLLSATPSPGAVTTPP